MSLLARRGPRLSQHMCLLHQQCDSSHTDGEALHLETHTSRLHQQCESSHTDGEALHLETHTGRLR